MVTVKQIIETILNGELSFGQINYVRGALRDAEYSAKKREIKKISDSDPEQLVEQYAGNWGCYDCHEDTKKAVAALNKCGVELVGAIRAESLPQIRTAMSAVRKKQGVWSRTGAADTEGREVLWNVTEAVCKSTDLNANDVWDSCYPG